MSTVLASVSAADALKFKTLYRGSLIPLHACLVGLVWIIHDYLITLGDEIRYIWPQKRSFGKYMFLWIRYYSIVLLIFDVTQIHVFSIPGVTSDTVCVVMDSMIRVVGALLLWPIEIIMILRIYAIYKCSMKVALINGAMFLASIGAFMWILIHNGMRRHAVIADAVHLPLPGCPSIHSGIEWAQWVPATCFEGVLFGFALFKTITSASSRVRKGRRVSLYELILRDNILYFFAISILLIFNNLMVVGITKVPWFSYSPFHAAMGILTSRMLINIRKATTTEVDSTEMAYMGQSAQDALKNHRKAQSTFGSIGTFRANSRNPASMSFGTNTFGTTTFGTTTVASTVPHPYTIVPEGGTEKGDLKAPIDRNKPLPIRPLPIPGGKSKDPSY